MLALVVLATPTLAACRNDEARPGDLAVNTAVTNEVLDDGLAYLSSGDVDGLIDFVKVIGTTASELEVQDERLGVATIASGWIEAVEAESGSVPQDLTDFMATYRDPNVEMSGATDDPALNAIDSYVLASSLYAVARPEAIQDVATLWEGGVVAGSLPSGLPRLLDERPGVSRSISGLQGMLDEAYLAGRDGQ